MTHEEWRKRMESISIAQASDTSVALKMVFVLAEEVQDETSASLSRWHEEQTLQSAIRIYLDMNRKEDACALLEELASRQRKVLVGAGHAAAQLLAEAALIRFQLGEGEAGVRLVKEALQLFGHFPEPNSFLNDAIGEWRRFVADRGIAGSHS